MAMKIIFLFALAYCFLTIEIQAKKQSAHSTEKASVKTVKKIFSNYIKYSESTDSKENEEKMTEALQSLPKKCDEKDLALLIDVWMYYDPTDFPTRKLINPIFEENKEAALKAIDKRLKNKKKWESEGTAPYDDLVNLRQELGE